MKVLQVNCVYNKGSTGKIVHDIHTELLKQNIESIVCYGRGEVVKEDFVYKTCGELYSKFNNLMTRFSGIMYGGCYFSTKRLINIIKKEKPDVVHLQCINGYFVNIYRLVNWLKESHIPTVLTLHAEFMYTGGCGYSLECTQWMDEQGCKKCPQLKAETKSLIFDNTSKMWKRMKCAFDGFNDHLIITSVSPWLMDRAKQSLILRDKKHEVVLNGVNTDIFKYSECIELKNKLGLKDEKIIFHATPTFSLDPTHIKGGYYVNEVAKRLIDKNVKIIVAGDYDSSIQVAENIILLGKVMDQNKLAQLYSMADVTLLTSKKETFSMVTAESLCCGTPVVGFKAGGPEQIAIEEYSKFVDYGQLDDLEKAIRETFKEKYCKVVISSEAKEKYSKKEMCQQYIQIYKEI